jgi:trehalose/maltose transport system permease protein
MVVNSKFKGRGLLRTVMLVPWAIPTVVSARLWETMLRDNQSGIFNKIAVDLGILHASKAWLADPGIQLNALIAVDVWKTVPFMGLLLLAGLQTIPSDIYEAADVDGASKFRQFFTITLPLLRPTIAVALVFRTLDALRAFDVFQVLLGRQRLSLATYNYETLISNQDGGYASAIGVVIFILIFIFTVVYVQSLGVQTD